MYYIIVILSVLAAAGAQMLLKKAAGNHYPTFWRQYVNPWVIGGYAVLGVSMLVNIFAMSRGIQLKEVGIIESLSYLFVPVLAFFIFGEKLSWRKIVAIGVIVAGIVIFFV